MAMTDEQIQDVQYWTRPLLEGEVDNSDAILAGEKPFKAENGQYYMVVNSTNNTPISVEGQPDKENNNTQAIAVAPCDASGNNVDYDNVTITVGGTQTGNPNSFGNAVGATQGLTDQTDEVRAFYNETDAIVKDHGGEITAISGHSQAGPAAAKVGAENHVDKVVNFQPWASKKATKDFSQEELDYLDKHCHVYTDDGKWVTMLDLNGGEIGYGKIFKVEGTSHRVDFFEIKGNGLDIEYYEKNNIFCSGMTEEQVKKIAKAKARVGGTVENYISYYEHNYGSYAKPKKPGKSKASKNTSVQSTVMNHLGKGGKGFGLSDLTQRFKSAKGSKRIFLRKALLIVGAASLSAKVAELASKIHDLMEESRNDIRDLVETARSKAFSIAEELSDGEVESLLSEIEFSRVWNEGAASENEAQVKSFVSQVENLSGQIEAAGSEIEGADAGQAAEIDGFNSGMVELL